MLRKSVKILHSLAAAGLIGGLACHMILLLTVQPSSARAYADLRAAIETISDYVLVPSLMVALVSGLLSMAVHYPFAERGWVWIKAALGILMFKGVLTVIAAESGHAARAAQRIADGEAAETVLAAALQNEWFALWTVMGLCIANVVLGIWRPRIMRQSAASGATAMRARKPQFSEQVVNHRGNRQLSDTQ